MNIKKISFTSEHLRTIASLLESGVSTQDAFVYIQEHFFTRQKNVFASIIESIQMGADMRTIFSNTNIGTYPLYMHLISSSQTNGAIPDGLRDICEYMDLITERKRTFMQILMYPSIVTIVLFGIVLAMLFFVVPQLGPIIAVHRESVPWITKILLFTSDLITKNTAVSLVALVGSCGTCVVLFFHPQFKIKILAYGSRIPFVSHIFQHVIYAQVARLAFYYLKSGMNIRDTLIEIESLKSLSKRIRNNISKLSIAIGKGEQLSTCLQTGSSMPSIWMLYIRIGEAGHGYFQAFSNIARIHESAVTRNLAYIQKCIEPVLMILIGLVVGVFAYAILLPMYGLIQVLQT